MLSLSVSAQICDDKDSRKETYIGKHNLLAGYDRRWYSIIPLEQDQSFYQSKAALAVANNIILLQMPSGGWRKNISPECALLNTDDALQITGSGADGDYPQKTRYRHNVSTLDNNATHTHIRFLLRVSLYHSKPDLRASALRGIEYLLAAQYPNGGWPQNYPNLNSYGAYITFNDGAMVGALLTLSEVASGRFRYLDTQTRRRAQAAYERGIRYILDAQIVVDGFKTGWAQQYLPGPGYVPARGRIYEIPAIATKETVGIIKLLRRVEKPDQQVKIAVNSAIEWLRWAQLEGVEVKRVYDQKWNRMFQLQYSEDPAGTLKSHKFDGGRFGYDKVLVANSAAPPLWAEYYDLSTLKPVYAGWNGVSTYRFEEVDYERRVGYGWFIPERKVKPVLKRAYPDVAVPAFRPQVRDSAGSNRS